MYTLCYQELMSGDAPDVIYTPLYWCNSAICVTHAYFVDSACIHESHA